MTLEILDSKKFGLVKFVPQHPDLITVDIRKRAFILLTFMYSLK